jgi:hypothetical protein
MFSPRAVLPTVNTTIKRYCVGCHDDRTKTGGLTLESFDVARASRVFTCHPDGWDLPISIKRRTAAAEAGRETVIHPNHGNDAVQSVTPIRLRDASWRSTRCRPAPVVSLRALESFA